MLISFLFILLLINYNSSDSVVNQNNKLNNNQMKYRRNISSIYNPIHSNNNNNNEYGIFENKVINNNKELVQNNGQKYIPKIRLVHFDLKGAPPKINYYKQIFPLLRDAGATGILLEYEDMFPFWGQLQVASAGNSYSKEDIKQLIELANDYKFEVIPLIQTFGHLEFFLKLEQFRHLREIDEFPQAICPSNNDSFALVREIVDQVMTMHPNSKWLHIGCDEVYHIGYCEKCRFKDRDTLFLSQGLQKIQLILYLFH
jgi:hypothetical protein